MITLKIGRGNQPHYIRQSSPNEYAQADLWGTWEICKYTGKYFVKVFCAGILSAILHDNKIEFELED